MLAASYKQLMAADRPQICQRATSESGMQHSVSTVELWIADTGGQ